MPLAPASRLLDRFPGTLRNHLPAHEVPRAFADREVGETAPCRLTKTALRSVLGVMNELKYLADVHARLDDERDLLSLSLTLAQLLRGPL
jgi:hypothetical protein